MGSLSRKLALAALVLSAVSGRGLAETLTNDDVVKLVQAGFSQEIIVKKIQGSEARFDVSSEAMVKLSEQKVPPKIIEMMLDTHKEWKNKIKGGVQVALQGFKDSDPKQVERSLRELKLLGPDAIPEIERQGLLNETAAVRAGAARSIGEIGHRDGLDPLFRALLDREPEVRAAASMALKYVVPKAEREKAFERLADMLGNLEQPRDGAVLAIGYLDGFFKENRSVAEVRKLTDASNAPLVRRAAFTALGLMGDKESLDLLIEALLKDRDAEARAAAAFSLAQIGDPKAVKPLTKAFENPLNRLYLIGPLSRFRDPKVVETLIEGLDDENPKTSELAWEALKMLTGERIKKSRQDWQDWWDLDGKKHF